MHLNRFAHANPKMNSYPANIASGLKRQGPNLAPGPAAARAVRGMTLPEMMVAVSVGSIVLMVMAMVFMNSARSFAATGNYVSMNTSSRNALDHMTRDIRQAGSLLEFSPTHLKFARYGQTNAFLVYNWDAQSHQLTEWASGTTLTNLLLSECDQLNFSMYNALFAPTTVLSQSKGISVKWKCSRTILGNKVTTEDMQQALIVMRNRPL